jgi:hypothetical protein
VPDRSSRLRPGWNAGLHLPLEVPTPDDVQAILDQFPSTPRGLRNAAFLTLLTAPASGSMRPSDDQPDLPTQPASASAWPTLTSTPACSACWARAPSAAPS